MAANYTVRPAQRADAGALLALMRALASFEGYRDQFCVTADDLLERGLGDGSLRQFSALVAATADGELLGYAVVYPVPFTFDLRPNLVLKELYVRETSRGAGVGHALMAAVLAAARQLGCARLKWDVLPGNAPAHAFYRSVGGAPDTGWQGWSRALA